MSLALDPPGTYALCSSCGYAIRVNHHRWHDDDDGRDYEADFWDHVVTNFFTAHTAAPKFGVRDRISTLE